MISYIPLNVTLARRNIKKTKMAEDLHISGPTLAKFAKNEYVRLDLIEKICKYLNCKIEEVVEVVLDK